jgi:hyperosmotically inducible protein
MKITTEHKKNILVEGVIVITFISIIFGLADYQQEGAAEKTGENIDNAVENAEQNYDLAITKVDQKVEAAKESLDKKVDKAQEVINDSTDASKGVLEATGIKIDLVTEKLESKVVGVKESVVEKAVTTGAYVDDSVITTTVKTAILKDTLFNLSHIEVATVKGIVTLRGTVDSEPIIGRAMEVVNSQKNVKSVKNDLIVTPALLMYAPYLRNVKPEKTDPIVTVMKPSK